MVMFLVKLLFLGMALLATLLCGLMWLMFYFGRGATQGEERRMAVRWTLYAGASWGVFLALALVW